MSFLTPLYVLGTLAVLAPIVFHLIRQSPRGEIAFSSLMFLSPTPPRLTRRSRLDHLLLLLMRALALCLLAFAFARPFLRKAARLDGGDAERSRVAILIDVSSSMRRSDIWTRAVKRANEVLSRCGANDQVALFSFDDSSRPLLGFEESATLDPAKRQAVVKSRLETLRPTWGGTDLGQALIDVVAAIEEVTDSSEKNGRMPRTIVNRMLSPAAAKSGSEARLARPMAAAMPTAMAAIVESKLRIRFFLIVLTCLLFFEMDSDCVAQV